MTFFDCTADLVGQLNGNGQKEMLQIDAPLSKISGYATDGLIWFFGTEAFFDQSYTVF